MIRAGARAWAWLVDGVNDLVEAFSARGAARSAVQVVVAADGGAVLSRRGTVLGRLQPDPDGTIRLEPAEAAARLARAAVDVVLPGQWVFRRDLDPVAAQGAPFLHAFVRHQIERVTPWRADDVFFAVRHGPLPADASRIAVDVATVPKHLVAPAIAALQACRPGRITLVAPLTRKGPGVRIPVGEGAVERARRRRPAIAMGLAGFLLVWPAVLGWLWWSTSLIQDDIAEADRAIDGRKAVMAAAARRETGEADGGGALARLRDGRLKAVDVIEALSAALPDTAYVTDLSIDKEHVRISGVSSDTPRLVPALETSGRFADAAFSDATTRLEQGEGDRFHLDMRPLGKPAEPLAR